MRGLPILAAMAVLFLAGASAGAPESRDTLNSIRGKKKPPAIPAAKGARPRPTAQAPVRKPAPAPVRRATTPKKATPKPPPTLTVSPLGGAQFRTLGDALKKAPAGARIVVRGGLYRESLVLARPVEILPAGATEEIIVESAGRPCLTMQTDQARVRGLTLRLKAGDETTEYAVEIPKGRLIMEACEVASGLKAAVHVHGQGADPFLRKCRIRQSGQDGVLVTDGARVTLDECEIFGNGGHGVSALRGAKPSLRGCKVRENRGDGLRFAERSEGAAEDCKVFGNGAEGISLLQGSNPILRRVQAYRNRGTGVFVGGDSQGTLERCDLRENGNWGLAVNGGRPVVFRTRIHHNPNGALFSQKSRGSMDHCELDANGAVGVRVEQESDPILRNCRVRETRGGGITFQGKGTRGTLIDCEVAGSEEWECVGAGTGSAPVLRRCRIRGGKKHGVVVAHGANATLEECDVHDNAGSNVHLAKEGQATLLRCKLYRAGEAGLWMIDGATALVDGCSLYENAAAGMVIRRQARPVVRNSRIYQNPGDGLHFSENGMGTVEGCEVYANGTSGVGIVRGSNPTLRKCRIYEGRKDGLAVAQNGRGLLEECEIFGNAGRNVNTWDGGQPKLVRCQVE